LFFLPLIFVLAYVWRPIHLIGNWPLFLV